MKRNSAGPRILLAMMFAFAASAVAQDDVAPTPSERAALQQLQRDPRFKAMAEELAELERLENDPQTKRATDAWHKAFVDATRHHLRSIAAQGDPQNLLAAALLWPGPAATGDQADMPVRSSQEKRAWFDAARRARPRDPLVAWIEANDCGGLSDSCDPQGALQFLLRADPGDAAVLLHAFGNAERKSDTKTADQYWTAAAAADSYDTRTLEIGQLLHAVSKDVALPPLDARVASLMGRSLGLGRDATGDDLRDMGAMSVWTALGIPAFQTFTRRCSTASPTTLTVEAQLQCERIMTLLAEDQSTLIAPMIGLPKMVGLTTGSAEAKDWRERVRQFRWTYENALPYLSGLYRTENVIPADYLRWVMTEGELVAMRRLLQSNGVAPLPPVGWLPDNPRYRSLVATGREPTD